jgi:TRAP-type C4-dicarboxylate transport system substrate-binding protein
MLSFSNDTAESDAATARWPLVPNTTRLGILVAIVVVFLLGWWHLDETPLVVIGQPLASGLMQQRREAPFFEHLRATTHLPVRVTYRPLESVGFKDTHQLSMLQAGAFDLVSLRFPQNRALEPTLEGIDVAGLIPDFATAQAVIRAYSPTLDRRLQARFSAKLLGVWTFGPQEIFTRTPIHRLDDLHGLKIRVGDASLAPVVTALGGIPAVIAFDDTKQALALELVDGAIVSAASAIHAGWTEHAPHYYPVAIHFGLNGYVISLGKWNSFTRREQAALQSAFDAYLAGLWSDAQELHAEAQRCGGSPQSSQGPHCRLIIATPPEEDVQRVREITLAASLPAWEKACRTVCPGCLAEWREILSAAQLLPIDGQPSP